MAFRFRIAATLAALLTLVSFAWISTAAPQHDDPASAVTLKRPIALKKKVQGIQNYGEVTPTLFRGAQPTAEGLETLNKMGVDIVVDLRAGKRNSENQAVTKLGMKYVAIPFHCYSLKDETFARFLTVVRENPGKKIFVHCRVGTDRTGMAIASYRMSEQGWSADDAMNEMRSFGFSSIHHAMCPGLSEYEENFPKRLKTSALFKDLNSQSSEKSK